MQIQANLPFKETKFSLYVLTALALQGVEAYSSCTRTQEMEVPKSLTFYNLNNCGIITEYYGLNIITTIYLIIEQLTFFVFYFFIGSSFL